MGQSKTVKYLLLLLTLFVSTWLGLALTGHKSRAYAVLPADARVTLSGETLTVAELAARYQPQIAMRPGTESPPAVALWYEVAETPEGWALVYSPEWDDEIHPNPWLHALYAVFRAATYGYPLQDVEYIQINVARDSGEIVRVRYETSPQSDYNVTVSEHWLVYLDRAGSEGYTQRITDSRGQPVAPATTVELSPAGGRQLRFGIVTWNHLLALVADESVYSRPVPFELSYLDDATYRRHKYARKSQGDLVTAESTLEPLLAVAACFGLLLGLQSPLWRKKR